MDKYRLPINRRKFLLMGSAALFSPFLGKVFPGPLPVGTARAADGPVAVGVKGNHEAWLKLTSEDALEPELPICDPHHHLWQGYLLKELLEDIGSGHNIKKTVYVEAWGRNQDVGSVKRTPLEETAFAVSESAVMASDTEVAAGIVGYADLMDGIDVLPLLEAHMAAGKGRFRGVRAASRNAAAAMSDPKYRGGCAALHKLGLSLDAYVPYGSFEDVVNLARAFPDMPIIVNHIGNPAGIGTGDENAKEILQNWKASIGKLAASKNIYMKLGGLGMSSFGFQWNRKPAPAGSEELADKASPLIRHCIETLGAARCMFESNFPVDRESFSYAVLWNAFKRMTKEYSPSERSALFYGTAAKVYRL